jgi:hypothetical protein
LHFYAIKFYGMKKIIFFFVILINSINLTAQTSNVGIGSTNPGARLEVMGAGTSASTSTFLLRNSIGDTLFRMRDDGRIGIGHNGSFGRRMNISGTGINFFTTNDAFFGGAIFPTDTSVVLWSDDNANNYVVLQPSWGRTGIGTYTPDEKLHIRGKVLVGKGTDNSSTSSANYTAPPYNLQVEDTVISNIISSDTVIANVVKIPTGASAGAFLISDANGNASWVPSSIIETDPQVQSVTNNRVPKWNGTALVDGVIQDDGTNIGVGVVPSGGFIMQTAGSIGIPNFSDYRYTSVKTKTQSLPASSFHLTPLQGTSTAGLTFSLANNNGGGLYVNNGVAGTDAFFDAPLSLPTGAVITDITLYIRDQSATAEVSGDLIFQELSAFTETVVGSTIATGVAATPGNTTTSSINFNHTILSGRAYFIRFRTKEDAVGLRIFGAKVDYTVTKVD